MDQRLWEKCVEFHGHACPGLAIGCRAAEAAIERLGLKFSADEEIVCVTENDACGVDAIQVMTGCTAGKGNLIHRGTGKMAYSFFDRRSGRSLRVLKKMQPAADERSREEKIKYILEGPLEEIFSFSVPSYGLPPEAGIFTTVCCELCGEGAPEPMMRLQNGKKVCLDCFKAYSRESAP